LAAQLTEVAVLVTKSVDFLSVAETIDGGSNDKKGFVNVRETVTKSDESGNDESACQSVSGASAAPD
jgi:hypothetical protein